MSSATEASLPQSKPQPSLSAESSVEHVRQGIAPVIETMFGIDYRALAFVRMFIGLILICDLGVRASYVNDLFTDQGMLPRSLRYEMCNACGAVWWISPYMLSGEAWFQLSLMGVAAAVSASFMVGYKTFWSTLLSWFFFSAILGRHPYLQQGGDVLLRCLLAWSIFLPMGAVWSVDAWRCKSTRPSTKTIVSLATAMVLFQLSIMYVATALLKTDDVWHKTFDATYYALNLHHFTTNTGYLATQYPDFLRAGTWFTWWLEYIGPMLLFVPMAVASRWTRFIVPILFMGFHLNTMIMMQIGFFPYICIVYWTIFLPSWVWDRAEKVARILPSLPASSLATWESWQLKHIMVITMSIYMVWVNAARHGKPPYIDVLPEPVATFGRVTGLDQHWVMFSPGVWDRGSWMQIRGVTSEGKEVDLWHPDQPLSSKRPALVSEMYPTVFQPPTYAWLV